MNVNNNNRLVVNRAITMSFDTNGNSFGNFNSIPFKVSEIEVLSCCYDDGGTPIQNFGVLWCDLFANTPISIIGLSTTLVGGSSTNFYQPNGTTGSKIKFNTPIDLSGQINFKITKMDYNKSPQILGTALATCCVIMEFRG